MVRNEKGFSLVELIIVIAIMAVLVGIVGTQVIPYLNRSREAKDTQALTAFASAGISAYGLNADTTEGLADFTIKVSAAGDGKDQYVASNAKVQPIANTMKELMNTNYVTNASTSFESVSFRKTDHIDVIFDFTAKKIYVEAYDSSGNLLNSQNVMGVL